MLMGPSCGGQFELMVIVFLCFLDIDSQVFYWLMSVTIYYTVVRVSFFFRAANWGLLTLFPKIDLVLAGE